MQQPKHTVQPLARSAAPPPLDWADVDGQDIPFAKDVLGLSTADRQALGMSAPRPLDLEPPTLGGAELALADVLARGGSSPRPEPRRKR